MNSIEEIKTLESKVELLTQKVELLEHQLKHHIGDISTYVHKMGHF